MRPAAFGGWICNGGVPADAQGGARRREVETPMSKRYPTEQEVLSMMARTTRWLVDRARRHDRAREALAALDDGDRLGLLCDILGIDEGRLLDALIDGSVEVVAGRAEVGLPIADCGEPDDSHDRGPA